MLGPSINTNSFQMLHCTLASMFLYHSIADVPAALRSLFGESTRTHYAGAGGLHLIITLAQQALPQHLRTQLRDGSELSSLPATTENSYINDSYSAGDAPAAGTNSSMLDHSAWLRVVAHIVRQLRQLDSSGVLPLGGQVSDGESVAEIDDDGCDDSYAAGAAADAAAADEHRDDDNGSCGSGEQWPAQQQQQRQQQQQQQQQFEQQRGSQRAPSRASVDCNNSSNSRNRGRSAPPARSRSKGASARLSSRSAAQRPYASSASPERSHNHQQQQQQQRYYSRTGQFSTSEQQQQRAARTRLHHTDGAKRGTRPAGLFEVTRPAHERVARAKQQQQQQQKPQYVERVTSRIGQQFAADRAAQQAAAKAQRAAALDTAARHR
jgi:hypothetical protein